jgi:Siphovirus-type tail component, C-terminal domain
MTTASMLVDEITGEQFVLSYDPDDPQACDGYLMTNTLDLGFPTPRAVGYKHPNAHGVTDMTQFWGDRAVAWSGWVRPNEEYPYPAVLWDKIRALTAPYRRPWLYFIEDGWTGWRRMQLRGDNLNAPLGRDLGPVIIASLSWKATNGGAEESVDSRSQSITSVGEATGGMCFTPADVCFTPECGPSFHEGMLNVATLVYNYGNVVSYPIIEFKGDVTDPEVLNLTTGETVALKGQVPMGVSMWVDTQNRTVRENNRPDQNRLNMYDFEKSNWLTLVPGQNNVRFSFSAIAGGSAVMYSRDRWI